MYTFYTAMMIIFMILMVLLSIGIIVIVVMQEGNSQDLGAITGASESFFGKNKAKTMDAKLKRWTVGIAASILVCSILFFVFYLLKNNLSK